MGEDGDIIFECHSLLGASTAIQLGDIVEEIGCLYYEEPVNYLNSKLHDKVAKNVNVPIAGGERLYHRWDVRPYLEDQSIDVLQPDVGLCGGFTEAKKYVIMLIFMTYAFKPMYVAALWQQQQAYT